MVLEKNLFHARSNSRWANALIMLCTQASNQLRRLVAIRHHGGVFHVAQFMTASRGHTTVHCGHTALLTKFVRAYWRHCASGLWRPATLRIQTEKLLFLLNNFWNFCQEIHITFFCYTPCMHTQIDVMCFVQCILFTV